MNTTNNFSEQEKHSPIINRTEIILTTKHEKLLTSQYQKLLKFCKQNNFKITGGIICAASPTEISLVMNGYKIRKSMK